MTKPLCSISLQHAGLNNQSVTVFNLPSIDNVVKTARYSFGELSFRTIDSGNEFSVAQNQGEYYSTPGSCVTLGEQNSVGTSKTSHYRRKRSYITVVVHNAEQDSQHTSGGEIHKSLSSKRIRERVHKGFGYTKEADVARMLRMLKKRKYYS